MIYTRILPIVQPLIDWEGYLKHTQAHLGRSVTASLDRNGDFDYSVKSFLHTIAEFRKSGSNNLPFDVLNHITYTFMIIGTESLFMELMTYGLNLTVSEMKTIAIISGTVRQWMLALVSGCQVDTATYPTRVLCNEVVNYFQLLGLQSIFKDFKQTELKDKSFILEAK